KTATPEIAQAIHAHIRQYLAGFDGAVAAKVQILYGGSVTGATAANLFGQPDIDGGLVGGASLKVDDFSQIIAGAAK
ncbi:MAG: triose-phosphate isomerase, partial [Aeromonas sp.]